MQVAILLYPRFTSLDVVGPYEVLGRLPDTEVVFVAEQPGLFHNDLGSLALEAPVALADVTSPDVVVVGGGPGQVDQMADGPLHEWLRAVDRTSTWTTSVCTGALVLAAAGLLDGRRATTHWGARDHLARYGATVSTERVVVDGKYVTAAGVSAGIDMALSLAGSLADDDVAQTVQLIIEYAPEPPYQSGSLESAPAEIVARAQRRTAARFADA
ncbi:DJ-1/PfpI family protein [Jatrophihabitans sp. YIM 134969]